MEVRRQVQRRSEALDERDRSILSPRNSMNSPSPTTLIREERTHESPKNLRREPPVPGTSVAEWIGKREDPLPHGNNGDHPVDEMSRSLRHLSSAARRTEPPTLTRECHETIVATPVAMNAKKAVG
jgi:hypothetical protein